MKKMNNKVPFSFFLFGITIPFSILSYGLIQIFYKWEEWVIEKSSNFDSLQIVLDTIRLHWLSFLLWNILLIVSALIIQKGFRKYSFNEKKLRYVLNSAIDGILLIDENGEIVDTNPASE
jgi:PAS domain-containing protein